MNKLSKHCMKKEKNLEQNTFLLPFMPLED